MAAAVLAAAVTRAIGVEPEEPDIPGTDFAKGRKLSEMNCPAAKCPQWRSYTEVMHDCDATPDR